MSPATGGADPAADRALAQAGAAMADRAEEVLPGWLVGRAVLVVDRAGRGGDGELVAAVERTARAAAAATCHALRRLAGTDVDRQRTTPLAALRAELAPTTAVLRQAGLAPPAAPAGPVAPARPVAVVAGDPFGIGPARWADVDAELGALAMAWGAAKAAAHRERHPG